MLVSITYDLNDGWDEVKSAAFAGPFFNVVNTSIGKKQAPNTTLFTDGLDTKATLAAFDRAVTMASAKLGRPIIVKKVFTARAEDWLIRSDQP